MSEKDELVGAAWLGGWEACRRALRKTGHEEAAAAVELPRDEDEPPSIPAPGADPGWAAYILASIVNWKPEGGFPFEEDVYGESDDLPNDDTPFGTEAYLYALFGKDEARTLLRRFEMMAIALGFKSLYDPRFRAIFKEATCISCKGPVGRPCRQAPSDHPHLECYQQ